MIDTNYGNNRNRQEYSTKSRRPFKIIYYEAYASEKDARQREKNLKLFSRAYYGLKKRISTSINNG